MNKATCMAIGMCIIAVGCFIGWLTGYNFDHRDGDVAIFAGFTVFAAIGVAAMCWSEGE